MLSGKEVEEIQKLLQEAANAFVVYDKVVRDIHELKKRFGVNQKEN